MSNSSAKKFRIPAILVSAGILLLCLILMWGMICLLFFFQYWTQNQHIYITLINNTITTHQFYGYMLTVLASQAMNTVLYRKTGSIWPGLILLTIVFGYVIPGGFPISITL